MLPHDKWADVPGRPVNDKRRDTQTEPPAGSLGRVIRDHRRALDLTQSALAERIGVNHSYISRIESNERTPERISTLLALAQALELGAAQTVDLLRLAAGMEDAA